MTGPVAAQEGPAPAAAYTIGIGDVLDVVVTGEPELTHTGAGGLLVGPDGTIGFPPLGLVRAAGTTCVELAATLRERLMTNPRWLVDPRVTVSVGSYNALKVNILGAVARPGSYPHRPGLLLRDAIAAAGGLVLVGEGGASQVRGRLIHADGKTVAVRLDEALAGQGEAGTLELQPGDTLIAELQLLVSVLGHVQKPGLIKLQDGARLSEAVGMAGGVTTDGDLHKIVVKSATGQTREVDLEGIVRAGLEDPIVTSGDTVFVPLAVKRVVSVQGYVQKPGEYELPEGAVKTVSDMIAMAGGGAPRPTASGARYSSAGDLTHVTLTRDTGEVLTLNIADVLSGSARGPEADPVVAPGDSIFVAEERYDVTILGHVVRPGRYTMIPGDTVADALAMAGGPIRPTQLPAEVTAADLAHCSLFRATGETIPLDLTLLPTGQSGYANPEMLPGDTLIVPEGKNRVAVNGYVTRQGYYEFRPGETVTKAIAMAGGILQNIGSPQNVRVRHADGTSEVLDLAANDPLLLPGDDILVSFARNRVAVVGYVQAPDLYEWHEGDTVIMAIAAAGGAIHKTSGEKGGNPNRAVVLRMVDGKQTAIPLDLSKFYKKADASVNIPIRPDDVIYVPRSDHTDYGTWLGNILTSLNIYDLAKTLFF